MANSFPNGEFNTRNKELRTLHGLKTVFEKICVRTDMEESLTKKFLFVILTVQN